MYIMLKRRLCILKTNAPIGAWEVNLENMTNRQTDRPTDQPKLPKTGGKQYERVRENKRVQCHPVTPQLNTPLEHSICIHIFSKEDMSFL